MGFGALFLLQTLLFALKVCAVEPVDTVPWFWIWSPTLLVGGLWLCFILAFSIMCAIVRR